MNIHEKERLLRIICDMVDRVLVDKAVSIGGYVLSMCIIVTLNNSYFADALDLAKLATSTLWEDTVSCPGAIIFLVEPGGIMGRIHGDTWTGVKPIH